MMVCGVNQFDMSSGTPELPNLTPTIKLGLNTITAIHYVNIVSYLPQWLTLIPSVTHSNIRKLNIAIPTEDKLNIVPSLHRPTIEPAINILAT